MSLEAHFLGSAFKIVSRDLEYVTVGIAEINGVRDLVILEFELDSTLFQLALRGEEIFPVRTKCEMKHLNIAPR